MSDVSATPRIIETIREALGDPRRLKSSEFCWCCPLCIENGESSDDTRYRLTVNPFKRESHGVFSNSGFFFCFNCGAKGTVDTLLKRLGLKFEADAPSWERILKALWDVSALPTDTTQPVEVTTFPCEVFLPKPGMESYKYITEDRNISVEEVVEYGIRVGTQRYRERFFLPSYNEDGDMDFYVARAFTKDAFGPKYLAAPNMPRKRRIYRYYEVIRALRKRTFKSVVITEGTISAIKAGPNAVATYGKYVSPEQVEMLASIQSKANAGPIQYIVALDGDALSYSMRLARRLFSRGLDTSIVMLPDGHDPASLPHEEWLRLRDSAFQYTGLLSEAALGLAHV